MAQMNLSTEQKQTHTQREQTVVSKGEETRDSGGLGVGDSRCQLLYLKWINSEILLCTFSQFSCSVMSDSDPMDCSTPGFLVHLQLLELAQTQVHRVSDAIQPFHPLSPPLPPAFNLFQHQGLFQSVSSSQGWPKYWSFSFSISPSNEYSGLISLRMDWLDLLVVQGTLKSLLSNTTVQEHQFFGAQLSLCSNSHIHTWLLEKPQLWLDGHYLAVYHK